jgi:hypothetical protein
MTEAKLSNPWSDLFLAGLSFLRTGPSSQSLYEQLNRIGSPKELTPQELKKLVNEPDHQSVARMNQGVMNAINSLMKVAASIEDRDSRVTLASAADILSHASTLHRSDEYASYDDLETENQERLLTVSEMLLDLRPALMRTWAEIQEPFSEATGGENFGHLRDARGLIPLAADKSPVTVSATTETEKVSAGAAFVAAGHQLTPEQKKRIADQFQEVGEHVHDAMNEANRELETWGLPPIKTLDEASDLARATGRVPDRMTYAEIIDWAVEYRRERVIRGITLNDPKRTGDISPPLNDITRELLIAMFEADLSQDNPRTRTEITALAGYPGQDCRRAFERLKALKYIDSLAVPGGGTFLTKAGRERGAELAKSQD